MQASPPGEIALHFGQACRPILGRHLKSNAEVSGELHCTIESLIKRDDPGGCLRHSVLALPWEVAEPTHLQLGLDTNGRVSQHHVTKAAVEDAVMRNA